MQASETCHQRYSSAKVPLMQSSMLATQMMSQTDRRIFCKTITGDSLDLRLQVRSAHLQLDQWRGVSASRGVLAGCARHCAGGRNEGSPTETGPSAFSAAVSPVFGHSPPLCPLDMGVINSVSSGCATIWARQVGEDERRQR